MARSDEPCPVCGQEEVTREYRMPWYHIDCPVCGQFRYEDCPEVLALRDFKLGSAPRMVLSHLLRQGSLVNTATLSPGMVRQAIDDPRFENPAEQADNLVRHLGSKQRSPGHGLPLSSRQLASIMGSQDEANVQFVLDYMRAKAIVEVDLGMLRLTFDGWERWRGLQRETAETRKAFMAMPFGSEQLDRTYNACFKPAVGATGFDLFRVDEDPRAGLIDDLIRVAVRTSRFLVVELSEDNSGAYWEAGYGEGLGTPVIYTCERSFFEDPGPHFDTRNRQTVVWAADDLEKRVRTMDQALGDGTGDYASFLEKWNYDGEQRERMATAIAPIIESLG